MNLCTDCNLLTTTGYTYKGTYLCDRCYEKCISTETRFSFLPHNAITSQFNQMVKSSSHYKITYQSQQHTCHASNAQHACQKAFKAWLSKGLIKKQPTATEMGGFQDVVVEII